MTTHSSVAAPESRQKHPRAHQHARSCRGVGREAGDALARVGVAILDGGARRRLLGGAMIALLALGSMGCDDAETSAPPDCPAYSGMAQERTGWRYSDTGNGSWIGTVQRRITSIDTVDDAQIITIKRTAVEQIDDKERDTVGTRTYRCDAQGLKLMSREDFTEPHPTFGGSGTNFRVRYNPGWLIIPTDLQAGQTWESDMVLTVASTTQFDSDETVQWSHRAEASSSDTPAGTFDSLRVTTTVDDGGDEFWAESSPVEGLVKTDQLHLDSYTP